MAFDQRKSLHEKFLKSGAGIILPWTKKSNHHRDGACVHYVMVSKFQWKPFWLATQRDQKNDWTATKNCANYDIFAQGPFAARRTLTSCLLRRDQRRASPIRDCPRLLPCADCAWSSMTSHVEQRSSRHESRGWFFFLCRVVLRHAIYNSMETICLPPIYQQKKNDRSGWLCCTDYDVPVFARVSFELSKITTATGC